MKTAVIFYSLEGNTKYVAQKISDSLNADLIEIIPEKIYPSKGAKKFLWGGASVVMGEKPKLKEYTFDADKYDKIIFGTPVWASSFTPPLRTFIFENKEKLKGKEFSAFVCFLGGGADKALNKLKAYLEIDEFKNELILIDPKSKKTNESEQRIENFINSI